MIIQNFHFYFMNKENITNTYNMAYFIYIKLYNICKIKTQSLWLIKIKAYNIYIIYKYHKNLLEVTHLTANFMGRALSKKH